MRIGINAGNRFWSVYNEPARARLAALGAPVAEVPVDHEATDADAARLIAGADIVVGTWGTRPFTRELLDAAPDLKLVVYAAGTVKHFVTDELVSRGITVCSAVHINARPVAEFVLGLILTSLKGLHRLSSRIRSDGPRGWQRDERSAPGYYGSTVGLVGLGRVSRILIALLEPYDIDIMVEDPYLTEEEAATLGVTKATLEQIMEHSDVVSLHHADVEPNWGIINDRTLALMRDGATLINTARGRLVDEAALARALETRDIVAYLDVTHPEPPADGHPFYRLANCILTPHVAGSYAREIERMGDWAVDQVDAFMRGDPVDGIVDLSRLDSIA